VRVPESLGDLVETAFTQQGSK